MPERQRKARAPRWKRKRIPGYTPEIQTAEELRMSVRTLRKYRQLGIGPAYIIIARQVHYSDVERPAWLKSLEVKPVRSHATRRERRTESAGT